MATLADIRGFVLGNLDRVGSPSVDNTTVNRWINQAIREVICARHNWQFMEDSATVNTIADVGNYSWPLPDTFKDADLMLRRQDSTSPYFVMEEMTENQIRWQFPLTTQSDPTWVWSRRGSGFRLRPIPDKSTYGIALIGWWYPAEMTADTNTSELTTRYTRLLETWATVYGFEYHMEYDKAAQKRQAAETELAAAIIMDRTRLAPSRETLTPSRNAGRPARSNRGLQLRNGYL